MMPFSKIDQFYVYCVLIRLYEYMTVLEPFFFYIDLTIQNVTKLRSFVNFFNVSPDILPNPIFFRYKNIVNIE